MKFKTRIWLLPAVAATVFLTGGVVSYGVGVKTSDALQQLRSEDYPFKEAVDHFAVQVDGFRTAVQAAAAEGDAAKVDEAKAMAAAARKTLQELAALPHHSDHAAALTKAMDGYEPPALAAAKAMSSQADAGDAMQRMIAGKGELDKQLAAAQEAAKAAVTGSQTQAAEGVARSLTVLVLTCLAALVALGVVSALTLRSVWHDLGDEPESLRQRVQRIAEGDLTDTRSGANVPPGSLLATLDAMSAQLRQIVAGIRDGSDSIANAAAEVAAGNQDLSQRTEQTSANLQQTASTTEQITSTVQQTAEASRRASELSAQASESAVRGGELVQEVVQTMGEITTASNRIGEIIGVIDGIAFQTNILALNAAVEAARAGEQGRGFAVVASEVRSLAQRSANAAREIKGLINESAETVATGSQRVGQAGHSMGDIVNKVQRVAEIVREISAATVEQSDGIGHVNQAVSRLDQMTQQNAALVEQGSAAAAQMREQASRLADSVRTFRIA